MHKITSNGVEKELETVKEGLQIRLTVITMTANRHCSEGGDGPWFAKLLVAQPWQDKELLTGCQCVTHVTRCLVESNKQNFPGAGSRASNYIPAGSLPLVKGLPFEGHSVLQDPWCSFFRCIMVFVQRHTLLRASLVECVNIQAWTKLPQFLQLVDDNNNI